MNTTLLKTGIGVVSLPHPASETLTQNTRRSMLECYLRHRRDRRSSIYHNGAFADYWLGQAKQHRAAL